MGSLRRHSGDEMIALTRTRFLTRVVICISVGRRIVFEQYQPSRRRCELTATIVDVELGTRRRWGELVRVLGRSRRWPAGCPARRSGELDG